MRRPWSRSQKIESFLRASWRARVPERARRWIRNFLSEAPRRARDFLPDVRDRLIAQRSLPPARLRRRVGRTSSRRQFLEVGKTVAEDLFLAIEGLGARRQDYGTWLDLGCGAGRVTRHLDREPSVVRLIGADLDREAIEWCCRHLRGRFVPVAEIPPTSLEEGSIDLVYCISVFTHRDEQRQRLWLAEIRRLLRPRGMLLASMHSPELTFERPDLSREQHDALGRTGFLFAPASAAFNEASAFHSEDYLRRVWGELFEMRGFRARGLGGYQDLSVWVRSDSTSAAPGNACPISVRRSRSQPRPARRSRDSCTPGGSPPG